MIFELDRWLLKVGLDVLLKNVYVERRIVINLDVKNSFYRKLDRFIYIGNSNIEFYLFCLL